MPDEADLTLSREDLYELVWSKPMFGVPRIQWTATRFRRCSVSNCSGLTPPMWRDLRSLCVAIQAATGWIT